LTERIAFSTIFNALRYSFDGSLANMLATLSYNIPVGPTECFTFSSCYKVTGWQQEVNLSQRIHVSFEMFQT